MTSSRLLLVAALAWGLAPQPAMGQDATEPPPAAPTPVLVEVAPAPPPPPGSAPAAPVDAVAEPEGMPEDPMLRNDLITVDYNNEPTREILRNVADLFELNLVLPETLEGVSTFRLRNVTWRQVFDVALEPRGYTYVARDNIILVVNRDALTTEPTRTEIVILEFAKAAEVATIIGPMMVDAAGERVQIDARNNALILTVGETKNEQIRRLITELDNIPGDTRQVMIDTKFIEASVSDIKDIGINWASLSGYRVSAGPFAHTVEDGFDRSNSRSSRNGINSTGTVTGSNGTTSTVTNGVTNGNPNNSSLTTNNASVRTDNIAESTLDTLTDLIDTDTLVRSTTAVFDAAQFSVIISALNSTNRVRLVSNPSVVSLSNEEARIEVTTKFPIVTTTSTPGASGSQITETIQDETYGITLRVIPQIRPAGLVSLSITPEVSNLEGFNTSASGNDYPIISRRTVTNRVNMKDGYTIALGGLVSQQTSRGETKVPVLGDLPFAGRLFRSNSDTIDNRNLIVFITARIIDAGGRIQGPASQEDFDTLLEDTADPRQMRALEVERYDLPGYRPDMSLYITPEERAAAEAAKEATRSGSGGSTTGVKPSSFHSK